MEGMMKQGKARHGMMDSIDFHLTIDDSYRQTNSKVSLESAKMVGTT